MNIIKNKTEDLLKDKIGKVGDLAIIKHDVDTMPTKIKVLEMFINKLTDELGVKPLPEIMDTIGTSTAFKKKTYREFKHNIHMFTFDTDCYRLTISEDTDKSIEIYWIETYERCKGVGTDLMNTILDIADDMNINVRAIPADFSQDAKKENGGNYLTRLRQWYYSFGFTPSILSPAVKYIPSI